MILFVSFPPRREFGQGIPEFILEIDYLVILDLYSLAFKELLHYFHSSKMMLPCEQPYSVYYAVCGNISAFPMGHVQRPTDHTGRLPRSQATGDSPIAGNPSTGNFPGYIVDPFKKLIFLFHG